MTQFDNSLAILLGEAPRTVDKVPFSPDAPTTQCICDGLYIKDGNLGEYFELKNILNEVQPYSSKPKRKFSNGRHSQFDYQLAKAALEKDIESFHGRHIICLGVRVARTITHFLKDVDSFCSIPRAVPEHFKTTHGGDVLVSFLNHPMAADLKASRKKTDLPLEPYVAKFLIEDARRHHTGAFKHLLKAFENGTYSHFIRENLARSGKYYHNGSRKSFSFIAEEYELPRGPDEGWSCTYFRDKEVYSHSTLCIISTEDKDRYIVAHTNSGLKISSRFRGIDDTQFFCEFLISEQPALIEMNLRRAKSWFAQNKDRLEFLQSKIRHEQSIRIKSGRPLNDGFTVLF